MAGYNYGRKKRYKIKYKNLAIVLAVLLIIILLISKGCSAILNREGKEKPERDDPAQTMDQPDEQIPDENGVTLTTDPTLQSSYYFTSVQRSDNELGDGNLVLVNNKIEFKGVVDEDDLLVVRENKNNAYSVKDYTVMLRPVAMNALNDMLLDFRTATGNDHIMVNSGYRTPEYQQDLYDEELAATGQNSSGLVAKPGYSEHYTGLAVDFTTDYYKQTDIGTGDFVWIDQNAHKYGFILRYPAGKESLTMIDNEPWHYRYVGVEHATVMKNYDLCLEEYIDFIKNYTIFNGFLSVTTDDGAQYIIYYTPKSEGGATSVYVPLIGGKDSPPYPYEISGNNVDGWIVSFLYKEGTGVPMTVTPEVDETAGEDIDAENGEDAEPTID